MGKESSNRMPTSSAGKPFAIAAGHSYFVPAAQAVVTLSRKQKPTASVEKDLIQTTEKLAIWGENNDFPLAWEEEIEKNPVLRDAIEKEIDRIYAGGLEYGYEDIDPETGQKTFKYFQNDELDALLTSPMGQFAFEQIISDYVIHRFPVPEIIFSEDKSKVVALNALPAAHFRLGKQQKDGYILEGYFSRNWRDTHNVDDTDRVSKVWILDPVVDTPEVIRQEKNTFKYCYRLPMAGWRTYYPLTPAYSAKTGRWLDIMAKTTETFDFLLANQMNPKYHIEIDQAYMENKYKERWEKADDKEHNQIVLDELKHFHNMLHGTKNSGNNILTSKRVDAIMNKEYSEWTITPMKGDTFDEKLIQLLNTAERHIQKAVGIDPSLQGSTGGGGMGAGSGSDKRESFNIRMATAQRHVNHVLSVYTWIIRYNGITGPQGQPVKLKMVTPYLQTLNDVTPDQRSTKLQTA